MARARFGMIPVLAMTLLAGGCAGLASVGDSGTNQTSGQTSGVAARRLEAVRTSPPELRAFLARMPKGADLHSHLSGAVYAETYIRLGAEKGLCFDGPSQSLAPPPCDAKAGKVPMTQVATDRVMYPKVVDALSMRDNIPVTGYSQHDQFFATFGRFGAATDSTGDLLAEVVDRAGRQGVHHLELMVSFNGEGASAIGKNTPWTDDRTAMADRLLAAGLADLVPGARQKIDAAEARMRALLGCGTPQAKPGCAVSVRYLQQVTRTAQRGPVYAQTLYYGLLAKAEPRVVGLNFVAPEDNPVALADYDLHMSFLDELHRRMPDVNVALHAGELTLGLVPPERLRDHIRKAVEVGHAKRIGHGVDVMFEDDPQGLLRTLAARKVAVEINLTSNDVILGVAGNEHPYPLYRAAGVPTVISTDDEGVSRSDLTNELQRAVTGYGLTYADLVELARASLEHSFLPGASLWRDGRYGRVVEACGGPVTEAPAAECATFLAGNEKARVQWKLENSLARFEREMGEGRV